MKRLKRLLVILLFVTMFASSNIYFFKDEDMIAATDNRSCEYLTGKNIGAQDYAEYATPAKSYLIPVNNGFMRVQGNAYEDGISVSYYDTEYNLKERKKIAPELAIFGGFYASDSAYFIVTGQGNGEENDKLEVYRITKYDKEWNRLGSCGLFGANTVGPFAFGSCRMDMDGQYLIVRTCHVMYKSADGNKHQANVTIEVDTSNMTVTDSFTGKMNTSIGYVSHSLNQFVKIDNHSIVSVDHGDAYPRSICFMKYSSDVTDGTFQGNVSCTDVISIPGAIGDNTTGASVGGFEISDCSYLITGNSVVQDEENTTRTTRNIFVAAVDKNTNAVNVKWLTEYLEGETTASTPHLVKISENRFMVLWYRSSRVYYILVDGNGNSVSQLNSFDGMLSDCVPILYNGKIIWYTWDNGTEKFYEIPVDSTAAPNVKTVSFEHLYDRVSNTGENVTLKCLKCGKTISGKTVSDFTIYWKESQDSGSYWTYVPQDMQKEDVILFMYKFFNEYSTDEPEFSEMVIESNDPAHCFTSRTDEKVYFTEGGEYTIKVYPKYYPEAATTYLFVVNPVPSTTPPPTATVEPTPTQTPELVSEEKVTVTYSEDFSTETSFTTIDGKVHIDVKKITDDVKVEEAEYSGIRGNKVKINSYSTAMKTVSIPKAVKANGKTYYITTIGSNVLGYSDCIETVKLSSKVTTIAKKAFMNKKKLKRIEIYAANLKTVGKYAFKGINSKAKIVLIGTEEQCEKAKSLIIASGIGKRVKIIFQIK